MFPGVFDSGNTASVCRVNTESTHALGRRRSTPSGDTCPPCPATRTILGSSPTGSRASISPTYSIRGVPNRRFIDSGLYLPATHSEGLGPLAVLIDTSRLLEGGILATFWTEIRAGAEELKPDILVVVQVARECRTRPSTGSAICPGRPRPGAGAGRPSVRGSRGSRGKASSPAAACASPIWSATATLPYRHRSLCCGCNWGRGAPPPEHLREPWGMRIDISA